MKKHLLLLLFLLLLALFPRTLLLDTVPNGLNWDETAYAYDAQSIIATGKDQWSIFLPFWLKSFGEYKPAIGSYLLIPTLYFWQWENWAVRLGPALLNSFAVLAFYGIIFLQTKKQSLAFVAGLLLAVTPWHIHFSRTALDPSFAFPFLLFGIFGLLTKKKVGTFFGFFSLFLSMWAYNAERLFIPLFLLWWFLSLKGKKLFLRKNWLPIGIFVLATLSIFVELIWGPAGIRATQVSILTSDKVLENTLEIQSQFQSLAIPNAITDTIASYVAQLSVVTWQYSHYFRPDFFFFKHGWLNNSLTFGFAERGALLEVWIFLVPAAILQLIQKKKNATTTFWLVWLGLAALPGALSKDGPHPGRALIMVPALVYFLATGWEYLTHLNHTRLYRKSSTVLLWIVTSATFLTWILGYTTTYADASTGDWQGQYRPLVTWLHRVAPTNQTIFIGDLPEEHILLFYAWYNHISPEVIQAGTKNENDSPIEILSFENIQLLKDDMITPCLLEKDKAAWLVTTGPYTDKILNLYGQYLYQPVLVPEHLSSWRVRTVRPEFWEDTKNQASTCNTIKELL